jgi:MoaA/NifB/PqqE/SkfB family radical SAM enzyme
MDFPGSVSFTITNACNLRCKMCGQWSREGYFSKGGRSPNQAMQLADWKKLVAEIAANNISSVLLRGGEPFLFPGIIELLEYINSKGIFTSIDTNGTMLKKYAGDIVRLGKIHITISLDGPEEIHDKTRGVKGCFNTIKEGVALLTELEKNHENKISRSICFTISPWSLRGLGQMPDVARAMSINTLVLVPYYYVTEAAGKKYEKELANNFNCSAFSWHGFHHETSGIDFSEFLKQYKRYMANLDGIYNYPYMALTEDEYRLWFRDSVTPVGPLHCTNVERLIDIQPDGSSNFCVDFPDYSFGNVKESSIRDLWNSERAINFREFRRKNPMAVCYRCGAKYMSEIKN